MANEAEKNLTSEEIEGIILTEHEARIITNLRVQAERNPHAKLAILFQIHDGKVQYGTLCLGIAPDTSEIRL